MVIEKSSKMKEQSRIACFSMKIGFVPRVPIDSGGLEILAGDPILELLDEHAVER